MDLCGVKWHKSSYSSSNGGACVEVGMASPKSGHSGNGDGRVAAVHPVVGVRDSKDPGGPVLAFSPVAWESFISQLKSGGYPLG